MFWIGGMFLMLFLALIAVYAIAAAVETIHPGAIRAIEKRLGFAPEDKQWEEYRWSK